MPQEHQVWLMNGRCGSQVANDLVEVSIPRLRRYRVGLEYQSPMLVAVRHAGRQPTP
jgi:hypothetical protein